MSYHHLNAEERMQIFHCSLYGLSQREIARRSGRSPATISRELRRGTPRWSRIYQDFYAHHSSSRERWADRESPNVIKRDLTPNLSRNLKRDLVS